MQKYGHFSCKADVKNYHTELKKKKLDQMFEESKPFQLAFYRDVIFSIKC